MSASAQEWLETEIRPAVARVIPDYQPWLQALILAVIENESVSKGKPTRLALEGCNLGGVKWAGKGEKISFPPNQFETEPQDYRKYSSYDESVKGIAYLLLASRFYCGAVENWIDGFGAIYCPDNPSHTAQVKIFYRRWAARIKP